MGYKEREFMNDFEEYQTLETEETPVRDSEDNQTDDPDTVYLEEEDDFSFTEEEQEEIIPMTIEDYGKIAVGSVPVGGLMGAIFMIVGLAVLGIVKIFKSI